MDKIKLAVIFGGKSTEHDVSVVSGSSVIKNLDKEKYDICPIFISKKGAWYYYKENINNIDVLDLGSELQNIEEINNEIEILKKQDVVFPVLHGLYGEDGTIQGLLDFIGVKYVGCKVLASSICMDKVYTKIILDKAKIKQAKSIILNIIREKCYYLDKNLNFIEIKLDEIGNIVKKELKYPVFIKPSNSGSSVGVNKANNDEEIKLAIKIASRYDKEILIEEAINGKEVECAVLQLDEVKVSCIGEIISANDFYDFDSKYKRKESIIKVPAEISKETEEKIHEIAIKAFKVVNGRGISRVDFFISKDTNEIYLNEINTMPGFTNISMYPKLWEKSGISYREVLDLLIEQAIKN